MVSVRVSTSLYLIVTQASFPQKKAGSPYSEEIRLYYFVTFWLVHQNRSSPVEKLCFLSGEIRPE